MTDIVFSRPRHEYDSYKDLWSLVELSGYPLIYIDEMDVHDRTKTYIFSTPWSVDRWADYSNAQARLIYWLIEWYSDYEQPDGIAETWTINETFAQHIDVRFVPVGSHPELRYPVIEPEKVYDLAHLMYLIPRRTDVMARLQRNGVRLAPNGWGRARNLILSQSRAMLHIHQHEQYPAIAPLRTAIAAAWKLPVIAENGWSMAPYNRDCVYTTSYTHVVEAVKAWLGDDETLRKTGEALHQLLCHDLTFRKIVGGAV